MDSAKRDNKELMKPTAPKFLLRTNARGALAVFSMRWHICLHVLRILSVTLAVYNDAFLIRGNAMHSSDKDCLISLATVRHLSDGQKRISCSLLKGI